MVSMLSGSGSPHTDTQVRAAFIGLEETHTRADLYQALLEGLAYELEYLRRAAEASTGSTIERLVATGGGTRNKRWIQIKADVSGCYIDVLHQAEIATLGAALLGGIGAGVYRGQEDVTAQVSATIQINRYTPDAERMGKYRELYEKAYLPFQAPLRALASRLDSSE